MQILATNSIGNPTNTVLASTTIADASVPNGSSRLAGVFASPAAVGAGQQYALALNWPGADGLTVRSRNGNFAQAISSSAADPARHAGHGDHHGQRSQPR
jgi:hypothetical protein